jgi:hypothetical protein
MAEGSLELWSVRPYLPGASVRFLELFAPAAYEGWAWELAPGFRRRRGEEAGVCVREESGAILGMVFGWAEVGVVRRQVAQILLLDVHGRGFPEVAERDPVVGRL